MPQRSTAAPTQALVTGFSSIVGALPGCVLNVHLPSARVHRLHNQTASLSAVASLRFVDPLAERTAWTLGRGGGVWSSQVMAGDGAGVRYAPAFNVRLQFVVLIKASDSWCASGPTYSKRDMLHASGYRTVHMGK